MAENQFVRPDQGLLDGLVADVLNSAGINEPPTSWTWIESGSSHIVVLAADLAIRVARTPATGATTLRAQQLVDALPPLPFEVPRSRTGPRTVEGITAIASQRLAGEAHHPGSGSVRQLKLLVDAIHAVPLDPLRPLLGEARSYCGGEGWYSIMSSQAIPLLPQHLHAAAFRMADELASLASDHFVVLNHGDLAGANVLWKAGRISGVLDWDLASADDPAEDLASIATWYGWGVVESLANSDDIARARVFHDSFVLQTVCFALINRRPDAEVRRAVQRATKNLERSTAG